MRRRPHVVLVTGAAGGIGQAVAVAFAHPATTVVATDIVPLDTTLEMVRRKGGHAVAHRLDVSSIDDWEAVVAAVDVPDVLVNNAGFVVGGAFLDHTADDWERQLSVNLFGTIHGCRVVGREMVRRGSGGHIVNIASAAAFTPVPSMPAYCVSKAGVKMLSECLRQELAPHHIGVTAICPGFINTDIGAHGVLVGVDQGVVDAGKRRLAQVQTIGARLPFDIAGPDEVARAVRAAVRLDLTIVPVRPEAWFSYVMSRVSPTFVRRTVQPFRAGALARPAEEQPVRAEDRQAAPVTRGQRRQRLEVS